MAMLTLKPPTTILGWLSRMDCKPTIDDDLLWYFPCGLAVSDELVGNATPYPYLQALAKVHDNHHEEEHLSEPWNVEDSIFEYSNNGIESFSVSLKCTCAL